jgi:hypothetical protein
MARYKVDRGDWHFDYAEQGLWNHRQISDRCVRAVVRRGKEIGILVYLDKSRELVFDHTPATMSEVNASAAMNRSAVVCAASDPTAALAGKGASNQHEQHETVKDCRFPWKWAMITTDGEVRPCCYATGVLANLNDTSFLDIWNGKKMQDLRRDIKANQVNSLCQNAACKYVQNMPKSISLHREAERIDVVVWQAVASQQSIGSRMRSQPAGEMARGVGDGYPQRHAITQWVEWKAERSSILGKLRRHPQAPT